MVSSRLWTCIREAEREDSPGSQPRLMLDLAGRGDIVFRFRLRYGYDCCCWFD